MSRDKKDLPGVSREVRGAARSSAIVSRRTDNPVPLSVCIEELLEQLASGDR